MHLNEIALVLSPLAAVIIAVWAIVRERKKPQLDEAQIDQVKAELRKDDVMFNLHRDRRILALERWGDNMRGWVSGLRRRDEQMINLIREERERCGLDMPPVEPFPEPPEFPTPEPIRTGT